MTRCSAALMARLLAALVVAGLAGCSTGDEIDGGGGDGAVPADGATDADDARDAEVDADSEVDGIDAAPDGPILSISVPGVEPGLGEGVDIKPPLVMQETYGLDVATSAPPMTVFLHRVGTAFEGFPQRPEPIEVELPTSEPVRVTVSVGAGVAIFLLSQSAELSALPALPWFREGSAPVWVLLNMSNRGCIEHADCDDGSLLTVDGCESFVCIHAFNVQSLDVACPSEPYMDSPGYQLAFRHYASILWVCLVDSSCSQGVFPFVPASVQCSGIQGNYHCAVPRGVEEGGYQGPMYQYCIFR